MKCIFCKCTSLICILVALVHSRQIMSSTNVCIEKVTDAYGLSEGSHWDDCSQTLYFVDIHNQYIRRLDPATGVVTSAYIENGPVGFVVPVYHSPDKLVAGVGQDVVLITWDGEQDVQNVPTKLLCSVDKKDVYTRINDGKVDSMGRLWLGTMHAGEEEDFMPNMGSFYRIDNENKSYIPRKLLSSISISNGLIWNTGDNIFYYIDSPTRQVLGYNYEPRSGTIYNMRIVFDLNKFNFIGVPDGMTIDTKNNLWIALYGGSRVICVNPRKGKILRAIDIPTENVTNVAFGGELRDILYVTTSGHGLTAEQRIADPNAGAVFAVRNLGVRGNPANTFRMN